MEEVNRHCENCANWKEKEKASRGFRPEIGQWLVNDSAPAPFQAHHWSQAGCYICDKNGNGYAPADCSPWRPPVGGKVWRDGVSVCVKGGVTDKTDAGTYFLELVPEGWRAHYKIKDTPYWTTIAHLRPASEAPEHYDGEPCELPPFDDEERARLGSRKLVYTGEYRPPKQGEPGVCQGGGSYLFLNADNFPRWILRAVPVEPPAPVWKPGQYAYSAYYAAIVKVIDCVGKGYRLETLRGNKLAVHCTDTDLRPLTPADWPRKIGGVKVRAYESDNGIHMYEDVPGEGFDVHHFPNKALAREFCAAKNLPIMPYALHQGKMDPPE